MGATLQGQQWGVVWWGAFTQKFEPQLGKSENFNNQGMKENRAFRILFITKKQLKSRQALHRIFLKHQYKVYRGASILYFDASFFDVPSFSKISQPLGQKQQMVNSVVYHPCLLRLTSRLALTFIRHLTLINSNLINLILLVHIANSSVYLHFEHFCV